MFIVKYNVKCSLREKKIALEVKNKAIPQHIQRLKRMTLLLGMEAYFVVSKEYANIENVILSVNL